MSDSIQTWPPCDVPNAQGTAVGSKLTSHKSRLQICHQRIDWIVSFTIFSYWANLCIHHPVLLDGRIGFHRPTRNTLEALDSGDTIHQYDRPARCITSFTI